MRIQLYSMLEPMPHDPKKVNLIGSNHAVRESSELVRMIKEQGYELQALNHCQTFDDYLAMAAGSLNILYEPLAIAAGKDLEKRLGQAYLYLPFVFHYDQIDENYKKLAETLHIKMPNLTELRRKTDQALKEAREEIGTVEIAIDYTFTFRVLSFCRLLLEYGFSVTQIYADAFLPEEREDFLWIQKNHPDVAVLPSNQPNLRFLDRKPRGKILAVGQKAAYFTGTEYFVNIVESGGLYGYDGILGITELLLDAFRHKKDTKVIIQRKGYGCESCI